MPREPSVFRGRMPLGPLCILGRRNDVILERKNDVILEGRNDVIFNLGRRIDVIVERLSVEMGLGVKFAPPNSALTIFGRVAYIAGQGYVSCPAARRRGVGSSPRASRL